MSANDVTGYDARAEAQAREAEVTTLPNDSEGSMVKWNTVRAERVAEDAMDLTISAGVPDSLVNTEAHILGQILASKCQEITDEKTRAEVFTWAFAIHGTSQPKDLPSVNTLNAAPQTPVGGYGNGPGEARPRI